MRFNQEVTRMDRRSFVKGAAVAACVTAIPAFAETARSKTNILIVITDEQSADAMSNRIGDEFLRTPNMDRLAQEGVSFTRAYCANPICVPSRTSMFTGRYPTETGVMDNGGLAKAHLDPKTFPFMGKFFTAAGYETAYFGKWHLPCIEDEANIHGFNTMATTFNDDIATTLAAAEYIQQKHEAPFLVVASYLNPHNICEWARGQRLPLGAIGYPPPVKDCPPLLPNHLPQKDEPDIMVEMRQAYQDSPMFPVGNFTEDQWRRYRWAYYRLIEKADEQIGVLLDTLHRENLEEETLVVFISDHGDCQGAHGWNQKTVLYEEAARVPFVLRQKGRISPATSTHLVNTGIDLIPTLCGYADIPVPPMLPGVNLREMQRHKRTYVVTSNHMTQGAPLHGHVLMPSGRMLRSEKYKYIAYDEGEQRESLVDLEKDPGEMMNVATMPEFQGVLREHRAMLAEWETLTHGTFSIPS
jgi:arylsulfatase A-like enzyme